MLLTLLIISVPLFGCSSVSQENVAKEVVKQYKTALYNIEDYRLKFSKVISLIFSYLRIMKNQKEKIPSNVRII